MPDVQVRQPVVLTTVPGVELAAVGTWNGSTGETTFTQEDLMNAVAAMECPGVRNPVIKLGHDEEDSTSGLRWDGEPALGWIANMHMDGAKLVGDYMGMPSWLTRVDDNGMAVLASAYPDRSIEIYRPFVCQIGHAHASVICAVALLGVSRPGVGVIKSMQDVYAAFTEPLDSDVDRLSVSYAGRSVGATVRMAAEEPREPTEREQAAGVDFAAERERTAAALDDLLGDWDAVSETQRDELSAQIAAAVDSSPDDLGHLSVDTAAAAALILPRLRTMADDTADATIAEAASQGIVLDDPGDDGEELAAIAAGVAAAMGASLAAAAGHDAAQRLGSGDGPAIAALTVGRLAEFSDRFLRDQLGGALSAAAASGRFRVYEIAPIGEWYASELNDIRTCSACRSIDGTKFDTLDEARQAYGSGKYAGCLGGARCRGRMFATWGTALAAPVRTTVRMTMGGPMPTATGGVVKASVSVEDISRRYYESAGYSMWITAMHVDPLELIVSDDSNGKFFRVSVELKGEEFTFGEPQEVSVVYQDVKAAASALPYRWQDRKAALAAAGKTEQGTDIARPTTTSTAGGTSLTIASDVTPAGAAIRQMAVATQTPDAEVPAAGSTTESKEGSGMAVDPTKLREALGLAADAPQTDVDAALAALTSGSSGTTPAPAATPEPGADVAALLAAIPEGSGAIVLDRENYKALLSRADQGVKAYDAMKAGQRDTFLEQAAREGRFPVSKLSDYKAMWDNNPDATRSFVELMPKNSVPTMVAAGFLGAEHNQSDADLAYEAVYGKAGA